VSGEGNSVEPETILPASDLSSPNLIRQLSAIGHKWAIFTNEHDHPVQVLNLNEYLREAFQQNGPLDPVPFCHPPIVVTNPNETLERVLTELVVESDRHDDRIIDNEVILYWSQNSKRIVTGPDLLGRLLHGIARRKSETDAA
jgi:hypothetical protein